LLRCDGFRPGAVNPGPDFDEFVRRASPRLLRTSFLLARDRGHAEDVLQEALVRTARHWRTARTAPEAYTRRVIVNLATDRWRARQRRPPEVRLEDNAHALLAPAAAPTDRLVIFDALRQLPYQQRAVAVLRYWDDASVAETAALLGISEGTVKSYSARAMARLRELISDLAEAPPC
jgi:RNA polymerase sigma-70 factor (sigma-E family)